MMSVDKFEELVALMEAFPSAYAPTSAPIPTASSGLATPAPGVRATPTAFGSSAGAAAGAVKTGVLNTIGSAFKDPKAFRQGGITGAIANAIKKTRDTYAKIRDQQLKNYFLKLDLPAGPPKVGSMFTVNATNGTYIGKVTSISPIGGKDTLTIDATKTGGSAVTGAAQPTRRYVVVLDKNNRPYFWPKDVMVSDMQGASAPTAAAPKNAPTTGYVKNEAESNNNYTLKYDTASQSFILGPNKTYFCLMIQGNYPNNLTEGTQVKGLEFGTNSPIEGVIKGKMIAQQDPNTKAAINVYPVEANFK